MDSLPGITTTNPTPQSPPNLNNNHPFHGDMLNSSATTDSFADVSGDLPLTWARDFVPLALSGSRLAGVSVIAIATWPDSSNPTQKEGIQFLAVATKSAIVLYETPKGSRAFRFVKVRGLVKVESYPSELFLPMHCHASIQEFYIPLVPRKIAFVEGFFDDRRNPEMGSEPCLFIIFDKQAGWLRLADSTVGVMTLIAVGGLPPPIEDPKSKWVLPVRFGLPIPGQMNEKRFIYILTRGFRTHIVSHPSPPSPPLAAIFWNSTPTFVSPRLVRPKDNLPNALPLLQLVAFSSSGIEIQEMGLSFLDNSRGTVFPTDIKQTKVMFEGEVEFLAVGRYWGTLVEIPPQQSSSRPSGEPVSDTGNDASDQGGSMGIYGWCRHNGPSDGRVFWIGGDAWDDWSDQLSSTVR